MAGISEQGKGCNFILALAANFHNRQITPSLRHSVSAGQSGVSPVQETESSLPEIINRTPEEIYSRNAFRLEQLIGKDAYTRQLSVFFIQLGIDPQRYSPVAAYIIDDMIDSYQNNKLYHHGNAEIRQLKRARYVGNEFLQSYEQATREGINPPVKAWISSDDSTEVLEMELAGEKIQFPVIDETLQLTEFNSSLLGTDEILQLDVYRAGYTLSAAAEAMQGKELPNDIPSNIWNVFVLSHKDTNGVEHRLYMEKGADPQDVYRVTPLQQETPQTFRDLVEANSDNMSWTIQLAERFVGKGYISNDTKI